MDKKEAYKQMVLGYCVFLEKCGPTLFWQMDAPQPNKVRKFLDIGGKIFAVKGNELEEGTYSKFREYEFVAKEVNIG